ncbi:MAG TPA: UDP-N-acetylmuramoyl-L-alanine--D-glutamate ligase [Tissierellia bacterium]|nr:UDP-N-acetylmuramoyl-L-alanine--D-glutamate ligase [Tissierellia bacterium]
MKQVLIIGFGKTGQAFYEHEKDQAIISLYDDRPIDFSEPYLPYDESLEYDYALISPGVSPTHPVWQHCLARQIPVYGEIEYASRELEGDVIGITGTNGKTTTTTLVFEMLRRHHERTFLAGNIGFALLNYVPQTRPGDVYVTELSSFQLETTERFTPRIAAITNLTPDHLQWHGTMADYIDAKFKIFQNMPDLRQVVINRDDPKLIEALVTRGYRPADFTGFSHEIALERGCWIEQASLMARFDREEHILPVSDIGLHGIHNLENCLCAVTIAKLAGVSNDDIRAVLREFTGIAHRYEVMGEKGERRFINDSKATNPDSTIPALKSITRPTVWIAGGMDKGSDFSAMFDYAKDKIEGLILFGENKRLMELAARGAGLSAITLVDDLDQAFALAIESSGPGYDILLSPASASWDMYPNFEARGEHFRQLVGAWHV